MYGVIRKSCQNLLSVKAYYKTNEFFSNWENTKQQEARGKCLSSIEWATNNSYQFFYPVKVFNAFYVGSRIDLVTLSSSIFFPLVRFITLENSFWLAAAWTQVNVWTVYFFSRLICMFRFCVFFSQEHQKMRSPGTFLLKLFQNSQHVFLSSLNLLALRAGISFLQHYIGWSVTSIFT